LAIAPEVLTWRFLRLRARFRSNSGGVLSIFRHPTLPHATQGSEYPDPKIRSHIHCLSFFIDGAKNKQPHELISRYRGSETVLKNPEVVHNFVKIAPYNYKCNQGELELPIERELVQVKTNVSAASAKRLGLMSQFLGKRARLKEEFRYG
jgi:hypothetical protein